MALTRARVLRAGAPGEPLAPVVAPSAGEVAGARRVPAVLAEAHAEAAQIVAVAEAHAADVLRAAEARSAESRAQAVEAGRREGAAALAAGWTSLAEERALSDERAIERTVSLARMLAERLLGEQLALAPARVVALAREVLAQVGRAERVTLEAHPDDALVLEGARSDLGVEPSVLQIHADPSRARGGVCVRSNLGTLDADLAPQLDRLAAALGDALRGDAARRPR